MALERTQLGSPIHGVRVRTAPAQTSSTLATISQMASLGAGVSKLVADQMEVNAQMDAQNDLINDSINPDKMVHQAAYAVTVAEGEATAGWNAEKEAITRGDYSELDPEDYQQLVKDRHKDYAKGWEDNPNGNIAVGAYNNFMLNNQPSIIAAQAGMWRKDQGQKQSAALTTMVSTMAKDQNNTADDYIAVLTDPNYSLLDPQERSKAAMIGAAEYATSTGDSTILQTLNDQFGYDVDPALMGLYASALKEADRVKRGKDIQDEYDIRKAYDGFVEFGVLDHSYWSDASQMISKKDGSLLFPPKVFAKMVKDSKKNKAVLDTENSYVKMIMSGVDLPGVTPSSYKKAMDTVWNRSISEAQGDTLVALENMGRYAVGQTRDWTGMKQRAGTFERQDMMVEGKANKEMMQRYDEIAAFERGLEHDKDGKSTFARYMGKEGLAQYLDIKYGLSGTNLPMEQAWASVAGSRESMTFEARREALQTSFTVDEEIVARELTQERWGDIKPSMLWPGNWTKTVENPTGDVWMFTAGLLKQADAMGITGEAKTDWVKYQLEENSSEIGGTMVAQSATKVATMMGVNKNERDNALQHALKDPMHKDAMLRLFGKVEGIGPLSDTMVQDIGVEKGGWLWKMITTESFSRKVRGTRAAENAEERFNEQQEIERLIGSKHTYDQLTIDEGDLDININEDAQTMEFRNPNNPHQPMYSIPLDYFGSSVRAKNQGIINQEFVDDMYSKDTENPVAREWFDEQDVLNDQFATEVLQTDIGTRSGAMSLDTYVDLSPQEKTETRMQWHLDNYSGVRGTATQMYDLFKREMSLTEPRGGVLIMQDDGTLQAEPFVGDDLIGSYAEDELDIAAKSLIKGHEGLSLDAYDDVQGKSIGYGHFIKDGEKLENITQEEAEALFEEDFPKYKTAAEKIPGYSSSTDTRKAALIDLTYNMGANWYKKFPLFTEALEAGDYNIAADELIDSEWYNQVGNRAKTIVDMIRKG